MKTKKYLLTSVLTVAMLVGSALGIEAQHRHHQSQTNDQPSKTKMGNMQGMQMDMSKMMQAPHHMLMTAHMKSMSEFARTLETEVQADKPDSKQVAAHTNALLKHLGMRSKMHGGSKAGKKKTEMKMKM